MVRESVLSVNRTVELAKCAISREVGFLQPLQHIHLYPSFPGIQHAYSE